jgi:hypothetical protein
MRLFMNQLLGLAAGGLVIVTALAQPAQAAQPVVPNRPNIVPAARPVPVSQPKVNFQYNSSRPIGWDWWRTYPYSPYNTWRNPYWYSTYNVYYPYAPVQTYPYYIYVPVPQPTPVPQPYDVGSSYR